MRPDLDALLLRFVSGRTSDAERERVAAWAGTDPQRQTYVAELAAVWDAAAPGPTDGGLSAAEKEADWGRISTSIRRGGPRPAYDVPRAAPVPTRPPEPRGADVRRP